MATDEQIIEAFVASFRLEQSFTHDKPPPPEMNAGIDPDDWNCLLWKPMRIDSSRDELKQLYQHIGAKFPPLYERLVLTWRWLDAWVDGMRLFANPPGFAEEVAATGILTEVQEKMLKSRVGK